MTFVELSRIPLTPFERFAEVLVDPRRRDRAVVLALLCYVALWTAYAVLAKGGQDLHFDMGELIAWSREPAFGYAKHPPFAAWLVKAWFSVFPLTDRTYYLLAVVNATVGLWIAWIVSGRHLDGEKRAAGIALLTLVPFFNFHALKFNANTVLIPLWAATTWWFLRSFETRSIAFAALAGIGAAAATLGKYWSVTLLAGLALAALADPRRRSYFASAAPWVTVAVGALVLAPHVAWLVAHDFAPFGYAVGHVASAGFWSALVSTLGYVAGILGYIAVPIALAALAARPGVAGISDTLWPSTSGPPARDRCLLGAAPAAGSGCACSELADRLALGDAGHDLAAGRAALVAPDRHPARRTREAARARGGPAGGGNPGGAGRGDRDPQTWRT